MGSRPRKRQVISREDRFKTRQAIGPLHGLLMTANMRKRYESALVRYFAFEELLSLPAPMDDVDLDGQVAAYVEQLWQEGDPRYWAEDTLSGFTKLVPSLRGGFRLSWSLVTAWQRNEPPQRCAPLSSDILLAMVGRTIQLGWHRMSVLLVVGFHCLLRTAEMYNLRVADFEFDASGRRGVLTLPESKSGTRYNITESVTITDAGVVRLVKALVVGLQRGELLYPDGPHHFRKCFDDLVVDLSLPKSLLYKPYSIRRGAATADFLKHGSMSKTCVRGRWSNEKSCRIYVNAAATSLSAIRCGSKSLAVVRDLKSLALRTLAV